PSHRKSRRAKPVRGPHAGAYARRNRDAQDRTDAPRRDDTAASTRQTGEAGDQEDERRGLTTALRASTFDLGRPSLRTAKVKGQKDQGRQCRRKIPTIRLPMDRRIPPTA